MRYRTIAITDEEFWEAGMTRRCVYHAMDCRFEPCTISNGVRCCGECGFQFPYPHTHSINCCPNCMRKVKR